jgi:hypothetical protein
MAVKCQLPVSIYFLGMSAETEEDQNDNQNLDLS